MNQTPSISPHASSSLYGQDLLPFIADYEKYASSAHAVAVYIMTHGNRYPKTQAINALGYADHAAFDTLVSYSQLPLVREVAIDIASELIYSLYVNSLGRLHIRPHAQPKPIYDEKDRYLEIGYVIFSDDALTNIVKLTKKFQQQEDAAFAIVWAAVQQLDERKELDAVLESVIDHVEHVESVCFYVGDRFFALIDRFVNLIDTKARSGHLPSLRGKPLHRWESDDVLLVAALHSLFLSGRSVRFEEFNGIMLSASGLVEKLRTLYERYADLGCITSSEQDPNLFDLARDVRKQTLQAIGKPWLRYRSIYGINFQKNESVLDDSRSSEDQLVYLKDFGDDYTNLVSAHCNYLVPECLFFTQLASACLAQDIAGVPTPEISSSAASSWLEALIEKIVASAVKATDSDYGMSSSLRNISHLMKSDDANLVESIHSLTQSHFFTCFVSRDFSTRMEPSEANMIATSVQKRMMFNRWHFIPGNLERSLVMPNRHWYYPPLIPDIAVHSDVHRAAHTRARVKFSIRVPGPDMSRPPLQIVNHRYRGFYDVRVVRMDGEEYSVNHLLRARRRTLWLEAVYAVLVSYLQDAPENKYSVNGFSTGNYLDLSANGNLPIWPNVTTQLSTSDSAVDNIL